jgi:molecular chaperone GrpE
MQQSDDTPLELNDQPSASEDATASPASVSDASDATARELAEQREKYLRLAAEYDNYRKRSSRERSEAESRGQSGLIKQLLDPLDDLSRFAHVDPTSVDPATIVQGLRALESRSSIRPARRSIRQSTRPSRRNPRNRPRTTTWSRAFSRSGTATPGSSSAPRASS